MSSATPKLVSTLGVLLLLCGAGCRKELKCPEGSVLIPGGSFEMGTSQEIFPAWQLKPRRVTLTRAYCMDRTEVTQRAHELCQDAGGCWRAPRALPVSRLGYNEPRDLVDWKEAVAHCKWKGGRLPTEAEWEFAARGTDGRLYPWGNEPPTAEHWEWSLEARPNHLKNVGSFPKGRSFFGLDDMSGNVKEWVSDRCGIHDQTPDVDPTGPDTPSGPKECYIVRGAAWSAGWANWACATFRQYGGTGGDSQTGFRCAYDPK